MKKFLTLVLAIVLGISLAACSKKTENTDPTAITITASKNSITVGEEVALKASVAPTAANQSVAWSSADTSVATVSSSGVVKGIAKGSVVITATSKAKSSVSATVTITVEEAAPAGITSLTASDKSIAAGKVFTLEVFDQNANAVEASKLTVTSSAEAVATVNGLEVTAVAEGEATLTIALKDDANVKTTVKITVTAAGEPTVITKMTMSEAAKSVYVGRTVTFYAVDQDKTKVDNSLVTWASDNEAVATVDEKGVVTAIAEGSANITVTLASDTTIKATAIVVVEASGSQAPESIDVTADSTICALNGSLQLTAVVNPDGASQDVEWTSSDTTIATVSTKGVVAGIAEGSVTIYAVSVDDETVIGQIELTVEYVKPESIEIVAAAQCTVGKTITISYNLYPEGASVGTVVWSVDQPDYASVTVGTKATRLKIDAASAADVPNGFIELTVTHTDKDGNELTASTFVEAIDASTSVTEVKPTSIVISGSPSIAVGDSTTLKKNVLPAGSKQTTSWTSSDETIATVDNSGKVTAIKEGVVYITATTLATAEDGSKPSASYKITVKAVPEIGTIKDMNGYALNVFQAEGAIYECDPRYDGSSTGLAYTNIDKEAKIAAWEYVESTWNCKLGVKAYPSAAPWGPLRIAWMGKNITTNVNPTNDNGETASIFIGPTSWLRQLDANGAIQDCTEFYEKYGFSSMNAATAESSMYNGKIYAMPEVTDVASTNIEGCIVYNYGLIEKYGLESPAKMYSENRWTYDDFMNWCSTAYSAMSVDEGMTVLAGQAVIWWIGMANAAGVKLADVAQGKINVYEEVPQVVANLLSECYENGWWGTEAWDAGATSFNNQTSIMQGAYWWFVGSGDRFTKTYWGDNTQYGVVPYPYPSTVTNETSNVSASSQAIYMLATQPQGYPDGITYEDVYKAWYYAQVKTGSNLREDISYNYDEKVYELAEAKLSDPYSVQVVAGITEDRKLFDPIEDLTLDNASMHMSKLQPCIQTIIHGADYAETWAQYYDDYVKALQQSFGTSSN